MTRSTYVFTSESVSEGHPDKVCDRISDAVLDAFLAEEPEARVAVETFATTNRVVIGGEIGLSDKEKLSNYMGRIDEIAFNSAGGLSRSFVDYMGLDASGKYIYGVNGRVEDFVTRQNTGESQWSAQVTLKYEF